ncbi:recombinase family protein [Hymenobacter yonginensis]|uniref:Recombinase family protein n=1 Tax=Hymenobacter yonginensis TaxID=748197 RepID=A0ABY7PSX4_9BACT|nr:recombinase family protein [Hymenobacter yonginensis]WBO85991.1 recombinase family protein [Hymenobacter yonginensis]
MRDAIYARMSTRDKGQDNESQLRAFAKRLGYTVYKEYLDTESGGKTERPQFQ